MTYATGTFTNANPGPTLYAAMESTFLTAGFTLADTVVIGSRTHKVLKSDAADNSFGLTWYLDVSYPTTGTTGGMLMTPFEDFDPATDLAYRGPVAASTTTIDGTTYSRYGATGYALETNWLNTASSSNVDNPLTTGATGWAISATTDRVIFMSSVAPGELHYAGFFEATPEHETQADTAYYPLIVAHFTSPSGIPVSATSVASASAAFTRVPKLGTVNWGQSCAIDLPYSQLGGIVGTGGAHGSTNRVNIIRRPVTMGWNAFIQNIGNQSGALVGYLFDVGNTWTDGGVARGDDLTDTNGDVWIATDDSGGLGLWFKAV